VGTKEIWVQRWIKSRGVPGSATAEATKALTNTEMPPMWSHGKHHPQESPGPKATARLTNVAICTIASHRNVLTFGSPVVPLVRKCTKA
jgi:hypothetical protein